MNIPIKIVIIGRQPKDLDVFKFELELIYGDNSVIIFDNSEAGLEYIFTHLTQKQIVILDYDLSLNQNNEKETGLDVLKKIREKTSLLSVIVCTTKLLPDIPQLELKEFINNHIFWFSDKMDETLERVEIVKKAVAFLDKQVDTILEQWILRRTEMEREIPYITTKSGKSYSLNDLLVEIRNQTPVGMELERNMINLTIDLLTRDKEKLND
jgi:hypothetical protein